MSEALFPLFLKLTGRTVVVVGAGPVAAEKAKHLIAAGARIRMIAPDVSHDALALLPGIDLHQREFEPGDLDNAYLVVAAAPPIINRSVQIAAEARSLFVLAVDDRQHGSAYAAATFERGGVTVALSSGGRAPALVAVLRRALESLITHDVADWMALAEELRTTWRAEARPLGERRAALIDAITSLTKKEASS